MNPTTVGRPGSAVDVTDLDRRIAEMYRDVAHETKRELHCERIVTW